MPSHQWIAGILQDIEARNAKPKEKPYKLTDERGLYLLLTPPRTVQAGVAVHENQ